MPYDQTGNEPDSLRSFLIKTINGTQPQEDGSSLKSSSWGAPQQVWNYNPSQDEEENQTKSNPPGELKGLQLPDTSTSYEDALKHYDAARVNPTSPSHFTKINKLMGKKANVAWPK